MCTEQIEKSVNRWILEHTNAAVSFNRNRIYRSFMIICILVELQVQPKEFQNEHTHTQRYTRHAIVIHRFLFYINSFDIGIVCNRNTQTSTSTEIRNPLG